MDLADLDRFGAARLPQVFTRDQCESLIARWDATDGLGEVVEQPRHPWGGGSYRMFRDPQPEPVQALRERFYPAMAEILNGWARAMGEEPSYPPTYADLVAGRGPDRRGPTPVLTVREAGDWNVMHRDPATAFPLQIAVLLSAPGRDFTGGTFVLNEQWPHMSGTEARPETVPLGQGDAVLFPVHARVAQGENGPERVDVFHGTTRVQSGRRFLVGILF